MSDVVYFMSIGVSLTPTPDSSFEVSTSLSCLPRMFLLNRMTTGNSNPGLPQRLPRYRPSSSAVSTDTRGPGSARSPWASPPFHFIGSPKHRRCDQWRRTSPRRPPTDTRLRALQVYGRKLPMHICPDAIQSLLARGWYIPFPFSPWIGAPFYQSIDYALNSNTY